MNVESRKNLELVVRTTKVRFKTNKIGWFTGYKNIVTNEFVFGISNDGIKNLEYIHSMDFNDGIKATISRIEEIGQRLS